MTNDILLSRQIRVETNLRCDFEGGIIPKGKFATQVSGDPKAIKAQGIYHGSQCYHAALEDYNSKMKTVEMEAGLDE